MLCPPDQLPQKQRAMIDCSVNPNLAKINVEFNSVFFRRFYLTISLHRSGRTTERFERMGGGAVLSRSPAFYSRLRTSAQQPYQTGPAGSRSVTASGLMSAASGLMSAAPLEPAGVDTTGGAANRAISRLVRWP